MIAQPIAQSVVHPVAESFFEAYAPVIAVAGAAVLGGAGYLAGRYLQSLHHEIKSLNQQLARKSGELLGIRENYKILDRRATRLEKELEDLMGAGTAK